MKAQTDYQLKTHHQLGPKLNKPLHMLHRVIKRKESIFHCRLKRFNQTWLQGFRVKSQTAYFLCSEKYLLCSWVSFLLRTTNIVIVVFGCVWSSHCHGSSLCCLPIWSVTVSPVQTAPCNHIPLSLWEREGDRDVHVGSIGGINDLSVGFIWFISVS